ncbi:MAG TPA: ATP-dependent 6-phosphofructokinase [Caldisericia bacterium]|nr:ATP-dependent 6-phosphofructokinase [Caldisericia bacterium]HOU08526.1 ATP-dependent 6-phosphofructokinase [Caldisericia bacterium]HPL89488.1 ATP-dependent 6-phosphofructokinase [Caldisericia bacterium]HQG59881.1 ATP-dependent 6-phosphofructokinase [Caldisericia bacterium]HQH49433.1 ATP-dependent 6-phosphofructokinase [Caldisericia bacterium]
MRRIGVVTSGADCPGLNAAIRAVARKSFDLGYEVIGVRNGWYGLIHDDVFVMQKSHVSGILYLGGSILGSGKDDPFSSETDFASFQVNFKKYQLTSIVVIGGFTSLRIASRLNDAGYATVGIPATIDNDVTGTEQTIGFDTAANFVCESLDRLHSTASSHHRVMVVEVMGGGAGWIALLGGLGGGADYVVTPEYRPKFDDILHHIENRKSSGKTFSIIVITDTATVDGLPLGECPKTGVGAYLASEIEKRSGIDTRFTVLGHLQRGGTPTFFDRTLATRYGYEAVELLKRGDVGKMVALKGGLIVPADMDQATRERRKPEAKLFEYARLFY